LEQLLVRFNVYLYMDMFLRILEKRRNKNTRFSVEHL